MQSIPASMVNREINPAPSLVAERQGRPAWNDLALTVILRFLKTSLYFKTV